MAGQNVWGNMFVLAHQKAKMMDAPISSQSCHPTTFQEENIHNASVALLHFLTAYIYQKTTLNLSPLTVKPKHWNVPAEPRKRSVENNQTKIQHVKLQSTYMQEKSCREHWLIFFPPGLCTISKWVSAMRFLHVSLTWFTTAWEQALPAISLPSIHSITKQKFLITHIPDPPGAILWFSNLHIHASIRWVSSAPFYGSDHTHCLATPSHYSL